MQCEIRSRTRSKRAKWIKKNLLLPHHVHQPSRILMRSLYVVHLFLHPLAVFGEGQIRGCSFQLKAGQGQEHFLPVLNVMKIQN